MHFDPLAAQFSRLSNPLYQHRRHWYDGNMDLQKKIQLLRKSVFVISASIATITLTPFPAAHSSTHLENDHKSNIEFLEGSKKAQQEEIQRLKEDIQKLRQLLRKVLLIFSGWPFPLHPVRPPDVLSRYLWFA
jgi:hypothetical protein